MKQTCILVLGMHRSGTSCLMGSLEGYGLFSGDISTWNPHNLKGNREHYSVVALNEKLLQYNNATWENPPEDLIWTKELSMERDEIISSFINSEEAFVGFKDPRTLFTLAFWEEGFKNKIKLKFVGTFRNPMAVAQSLQKREGMPTELAVNLWKKYNERLLQYHDKDPFPILSFDNDEKEYIEYVNKAAKQLELISHKMNENVFFDNSIRNNREQNIEDMQARQTYETLKKISKKG